MNGFGRRGVVALVAATLTFAGFATMTSAGAASRRPLGAAGLTGRTVFSVHSAGEVPNSNMGAGYVTQPGGFDGVASVGATFTVPTISCQKRHDLELLLPGIWVLDSEGNLTEQVEVNLTCRKGSIVQDALICVTGRSCIESLAIDPGDVIEASLVYTSRDTVGTVRDRTQHTSAQVVGNVVTTDYTVFVGDLGPNVLRFSGAPHSTRVPTFTAVPFSSVQVNGQYLSDWPPAPSNLKTAKASQIRTSAISRDQDFTTTFLNN